MAGLPQIHGGEQQQKTPEEILADSLTANTKAAVEEVKAVGKEPVASTIPISKSIPEPEIRPPVGSQAPLRQPGEVAAAQTPVSPAPETPPENVIPPTTPALAQKGVEKAIEPQPGGIETQTPIRDPFREVIESDATPQKKASDIRRLAAEVEISVKDAQERVESQVVRIADEIARDPEIQPKEKFDKLIDVYDKQPTLGARTSTSVENQAYSTPAPLAFALRDAIGVREKTPVYEPTAGNGLLMIGSDFKGSHANELNDVRVRNLKDLGIGTVSKQDATKFQPGEKFESVLANPPFGTIDPVNYNGFKITKLEHLISLKALEAMADDGTAAIILGAKMQPGEIGKGAQWIFENYLYGHYNVVGNFEVAGDLYSKQGASWPVRVIAIDGRKANPVMGDLAPKGVERLTSWEQVWDKSQEIKNAIDTSRQAVVPEGAPGISVPPERRPITTAEPGGASRPASTPVEPTGEAVRPAGVRTGEPPIGGELTTRVPGQPTEQVTERPATPPRPVSQPPIGGKPTPRMEGGERPVIEPTTRPAEPNVPGSEVAEPGKVPKPPPVVPATEFQNTYEPRSKATPFGTLTPKNISHGEHAALDELVKRNGPVDDFVANRVGMDVDELRKVAAAEQIDGAALAIDQIERGGAAIIGDQTGIGKGRQGALVIRYALQNGKLPIFFTKDPKLFSDMYADLQDVNTDIKPLIFGETSKATIVDSEGNVIIRAPASNVQRREIERITDKGIDGSGYNAIFSTYSQINTRNTRQLFLEHLAENNPTVIVLDEAHEAAGDARTSMQAAFMSGGKVKRGSGKDMEIIQVPGLLNGAGTKADRGGGVLYMSATYAKRPENMPVYFRTALSTAADSFGQIVDAMKRGGVALQQAVSESLAKVGQYVRRERDFSGVGYDMKKVEVEDEVKLKEDVDGVTDVLSEIVRFNRSIREAVKAENEMKSTAQSESQIDMTDFAAIVHNQLGQLLLAAKADAVVKEAIAAKARGEKPVIALMNTMESFLSQYTAEHGIKAGSNFQLRWNELLKYALDRSLRASEKLPNGDTVIHTLNPDDYGMRHAYDSIKELADDVSVKFPISPIDYIVQKLNAAGVKMAELTGRESGLRYTNFDTGDADYVHFKRANKNAVVNGFNSGRYDGMLLNASGSTGLSAHASERFTDQRPRHMIVVQPALDINVFVQTLGRILRTGMVKLGMGEKGPYGARYTHLVLPLNAEMRPAAMAARKMKSLNANTTAEAENAIKIDAEDIFNRYGDSVVAEYMDQNPDMQAATGLRVEQNEEGNLEYDKDLARRFTGRMALLPDAEQAKAYSEILPAYRDLVKQLKATGEYDLEVAVHDDWKGKLNEDKELQAGTDESNLFTASLRLQNWEVRDTGHVPTGAEMEREFKKNLTSSRQAMSEWGKYQDKVSDYYNKRRASIAEDLKSDDEKVAEKARHQLDILQTSENQWKTLSGKIEDVVGDSGKVVDLSNRETGDQYRGMLVDVKYPTRPSPSGFKFKFMVDDSSGSIHLSASSFSPDKWAKDLSDTRISDLQGGKADARVNRYVVTGNPIRGYNATGGKGKMVRFKTEDGNVVTGLLMPKNWGPENLVNDPRLDLVSGAAAAHFLRRFDDPYNPISLEAGNVVRITRSRVGSDYTISVPSAKSTGGSIYLDKPLRQITGDFVKTGARMIARIHETAIPDVVDRIMGIVKQRFRPVGEAEELAPKVSESNHREGGSKMPPPRQEPPAAPFGSIGPGAASRNEPKYTAAAQLADRLKAAPPGGVKERVSAREKIADEWAKGKTAFEKSMARIQAIKESLKETARGVRTPTDMDRRIGELDWELQKSSAESRNMGRVLERTAPNKLLREATAIWIDAGKDSEAIKRAISELPEGTPPRILKTLELAADLPAEGKRLAEDIEAFNAMRETDAIDSEIFERGLEDYYTHVWGKPENMPDSLRAALSNGKLSTYFQFARERKIPTFLEGIVGRDVFKVVDSEGGVHGVFETHEEAETAQSEMGGETTIEKDKTPQRIPILDPAKVLPFYNYALDRAIASRKFIQDISELTAKDGRPVLAATGTRQEITAKDYAVVNDETGRARRVFDTEDKANAEVREGENVQEREKPMILIRPQGKYADLKDYEPVNHPALRKWKWAETDETGKSTLYQGELQVHPDYFRRIANFMDRGRLTAAPLTKSLLRASGEVKALKLGLFSLFHDVHVASHAVWHWTNPLKALKGEIDWESPDTRFAVEQGHLKLAPDPAELNIYAEGTGGSLGSLAHKIPIWGPLSRAHSEWLFTEFIPQLKLRTFENAYARNIWARDHLPGAISGLKGLTDEEVASRVGDSVNNAYGELNHLFLGKHGRNPQIQRLLRGIFLAPDFGESRLRFTEKAFTKTGLEERLALATLALTMYSAARVANWMSHGDPETDFKNAFRVKVGDHWWSMRSVGGDLIHAMTDFGNFAYVRLNPLYARTISDMIFQRDVRTGLKLTAWDKFVKRPLEQVVPINFSGMTQPDKQVWESFVTSLGVQTQRETPIQATRRMFQSFKESSSDPKIQAQVERSKQEAVAPSDYHELDLALEFSDYDKAVKAMEKLRITHTDKAILERMNPRTATGMLKPLFNDKKVEKKFYESLPEDDKKVFDQAVKERRDRFDAFKSIWRERQPK